MNRSNKRIRIIILLILLFIVTDAAFLMLYLHAVRIRKSEEASDHASSGQTETVQTLSMPEDYLPQNLKIGETLPYTDFSDENGKTVSISEYETKPLWIIFWASWCPDCRNQLKQADMMQKLAEKYGVEILLIDRLNPQKESVSAAQKELESLGITFDCIYDQDEVAYKKWGIKEIPTSVVLDQSGRVVAYDSNTLTEGEAEAMLQNGLYGYDSATMLFIRSNMTGESGEIYTDNSNGQTAPSGKDSLSESMGLMLQYAVMKKDEDLFDQTWNATKQLFENEGLAAWYIDDKGNKADCNALIDDLRIWDSLAGANQLWKTDEEGETEISNAIYGKCTDGKHRLVDFCNFSVDSRASEIATCYICPEILGKMEKKNGNYAETAQLAHDVLNQAFISDSFPFYYSSYSYETKSYSQDDLNMAEALYTIYNLSRAGQVKDTTLKWIREHVMNGNLGARYRVDGTVVQGYEYHSTAVYGLAALIAKETGDEETFNKAVQRMERYRINDAASAYNGAFTADEKSYESFDQLIPLLVYAERY